jgi:hypothetical protein
MISTIWGLSYPLSEQDKTASRIDINDITSFFIRFIQKIHSVYQIFFNYLDHLLEMGSEIPVSPSSGLGDHQVMFPVHPEYAGCG